MRIPLNSRVGFPYSTLCLLALLINAQNIFFHYSNFRRSFGTGKASDQLVLHVVAGESSQFIRDGHIRPVPFLLVVAIRAFVVFDRIRLTKTKIGVIILE